MSASPAKQITYRALFTDMSFFHWFYKEFMGSNGDIQRVEDTIDEKGYVEVYGSFNVQMYDIVRSPVHLFVTKKMVVPVGTLDGSWATMQKPLFRQRQISSKLGRLVNLFLPLNTLVNDLKNGRINNTIDLCEENQANYSLIATFLANDYPPIRDLANKKNDYDETLLQDFSALCMRENRQFFVETMEGWKERGEYVVNDGLDLVVPIDGFVWYTVQSEADAWNEIEEQRQRRAPPPLRGAPQSPPASPRSPLSAVSLREDDEEFPVMVVSRPSSPEPEQGVILLSDMAKEENEIPTLSYPIFSTVGTIAGGLSKLNAVLYALFYRGTLEELPIDLRNFQSKLTTGTQDIDVTQLATTLGVNAETSEIMILSNIFSKMPENETLIRLKNEKFPDRKIVPILFDYRYTREKAQLAIDRQNPPTVIVVYTRPDTPPLENVGPYVHYASVCKHARTDQTYAQIYAVERSTEYVNSYIYPSNVRGANPEREGFLHFYALQ